MTRRNDDERGTDASVGATIGLRTLTTVGMALLLVGSLLVAGAPAMAETSDGIDRTPTEALDEVEPFSAPSPATSPEDATILLEQMRGSLAESVPGICEASSGSTDCDLPTTQTSLVLACIGIGLTLVGIGLTIYYGECGCEEEDDEEEEEETCGAVAWVGAGDGAAPLVEVGQTSEGEPTVGVNPTTQPIQNCAEDLEACDDASLATQVDAPEGASARAEAAVGPGGASGQAAASAAFPCWILPFPYDWLCEILTPALAVVDDACDAAETSTRLGFANETTGETDGEPTVSCQDGELSIVAPPFPPHCPYAPPCDWTDVGLPSI